MRHGASRPLVAIALAVSLLGCRKMLQKRTPQTYDAGRFTSLEVRDAGPPTMTPRWRDTEVSFDGVTGTVSFSYNGTKLLASVRDAKPGDSIEIGADKATATSTRYMSAQADVGDKLVKLKPSDALDYKFRFNPEVKVNLVLNGNAVTIDAPSQAVSYAITGAFRKVADTPLALPLPDKPPTEHTVLFADGVSGGEPIGPAATVDAIDWVALTTKLPDRTSTKMCTGYKKAGEPGGGDALALIMHDQKLSVYDVRHSKEIASKDFKAPDQCPSVTFTREASSYASRDDMKAWLRTLRTKK